jgi:CspA family cold shock protein
MMLSDTLTGTVKWFNNAKGWGFIKQDTGPDVFVHYSQISGDGFRTLHEGEVVRFTLKDGPRGPLAEQVFKLDEPKVEGASESSSIEPASIEGPVEITA